MASVCNNEIDFSPDLLNMRGAREGFEYAFSIVFKDRQTGALVDISADSFSMEIKDTDLITVETLTMGSGLSLDGDNTLIGLVGTGTTSAAGTYTYLLVWDIAATSASVPAVEGKIIVE